MFQRIQKELASRNLTSERMEMLEGYPLGVGLSHSVEIRRTATSPPDLGEELVRARRLVKATQAIIISALDVAFASNQTTSPSPDSMLKYIEGIREKKDSFEARCKKAINSSLVEERLELLENAVPVVKSVQEPVSTVLGELLCSKHLRAVEEELQESIGLPPDDLHATIEFLCELLTPGMP